MNISSGQSVGAHNQYQAASMTSNSSEEFKAIFAEAKTRLQDPLGTMSGRSSMLFDPQAPEEESTQISETGFDFSGGTTEESDPFSGIDSINRRMFSEIYSTIQTRFDQLKQVQAAKESGAVTSQLADVDVDNLTAMTLKVGEYLATSESMTYRRKAEKTLVQLITKLGTEADRGNRYAEKRLNELIGKFPVGSIPETVLASFLEDSTMDSSDEPILPVA
jgi:hypothetical protein